MNWSNKAHKRIEKQKADEKYSKDLRNALDLFFLITADYLHRHEGYSKRDLLGSSILQFNNCITRKKIVTTFS